MVTSGRTFRLLRCGVLATSGCMAAVALTAPASADVRRERAAQANATKNPACAVLSEAEVRKITGYPDHNMSPGDPPGQGAGGGSSCQYVTPAFGATKAPMVSLVLIDGKNWTSENRRLVKLPAGCKREPVPALGDEAYFEVCPAPRPIRTSPLYVKAGTKDLIVQIDIQAPDTEATLRPKVIALAKAAVAKLR